MDIVVWLRSLGLGRYGAALSENEIDETLEVPDLQASATVKKHPNFSDAGYLRAVEAAFENREAMQKAGR
jgi:hypothetical protein